MPEKPSRKKEVKEVEVIVTAKNDNGEVFKVGDYIIVKDLLSKPTTAIISSFYCGSNDRIWVVYEPAELPADEKWEWERGFMNSSKMVRAIEAEPEQ